MTMIVRYARQPCPYCGAILDASMGFDDDIEPNAGDVSVCCACRGFLIWEHAPAGNDDADFVQRKIGKREFNELPGSVRADLLRMRAKLEEIAQQAKGH
jgi:hypothetical protein